MGAGLLWLWLQPWGRVLLAVAAAAVVVACVGYVANLPRRRRARLLRLATLQGLLELTPRQFEHEVADLLTSMGFSNVTVSGGAGDLQADIVARDPDGRVTVVQCKRYAPSRKIGSPVVQSFIGMAQIHHGADRAMFFATCGFSRPTCQLAAEHGVELLDEAQIIELFTQRTAVRA